MDNSQSAGTFIGVQLLRFIAALMVVVTHATFYVSTRIDSSVVVWDVGTAGVPIFFVISGFVMALTSRPLLGRPSGAKRFILSRLIRIVPLYWLLNLLKLCLFVLLPGLAFATPDFGNIVLSLLFIPSRNSLGAIETFYGVGWTLNFEMFFYLIFAIAILVRAKIVPFVGGVLLLVAGASIFWQESWPAITFLCNTLVLNFLWGILIAQVVVTRAQISFYLGGVLAILGLGIIFLFPHEQLLGAQYAMLVGGTVFVEAKLADRIPRLFRFGGDASYSLYLVHPMVGVFVAVALSQLQVKSALFSSICIILASLAAAAFTFVYFERPTTRYLKKRFMTMTEADKSLTDQFERAGGTSG